MVATGRGVVRPGPDRARDGLRTVTHRGRRYTWEEFLRVCLAERELEEERKRRAQEEAQQWRLDRLVREHQQYREERRRMEQRKLEEASWAAAARRAAIAASREPPKPVRRKSVYLTYAARRRFKAALPVVVMVLSVLAVLSIRPRFDFGIAPTEPRTPAAVEQSQPLGIRTRRGALAPGRRLGPRPATAPASRRRRQSDGLPPDRGWPFPLPPPVNEGHEEASRVVGDPVGR